MKIMVIGSFNGSNYGDNAILDSIILQIEKIHGTDCKIYIPCSNLEYVQKKYSSKKHVIPISIRLKTGAIRFFSIQTLRLILKVDKIATTAGILFDYNSRKFISSSFVVSLTPLLLIAKLFKKEIIGLNVGIINNKTNGEWFLKTVLKQHDVVYLRDSSDKQVLKDMNLKTKSIDSADIVFTNSLLRKYSEQKESENAQIIIGINLNAYLNNFSDDINKISLESFLNTISSNLDKIIEKYSCEIHFFPTAKMDIDIHNKVVNSMQHKQNCKIIYERNVESILIEMSKVKLFIGMRMHSLIFATILNKPVISLNYSPKVRGFMNQLQLEEFSYDLDTLSNDTIYLAVNNIFLNVGKYQKLQKQNYLLLKEKASNSLKSLY